AVQFEFLRLRRGVPGRPKDPGNSSGCATGSSAVSVRATPRRLLAAFAAVVIVVGQAGSALAAASAARGPGAPATSAPIQKGLLEKLATGKTDTFVAEFAAKADPRAATKIAGHTARGKFVLDTLTANARKSQATAQALAKQAGIKAKSYWLYNEMIVHGT